MLKKVSSPHDRMVKDIRKTKLSSVINHYFNRKHTSEFLFKHQFSNSRTVTFKITIIRRFLYVIIKKTKTRLQKTIKGLYYLVLKGEKT